MISKSQSDKRKQNSAEREIVIDDNRTQHVRLVFAMQRLESCLGHAAPGREAAWQEEVNQSLDLLIAAMSESRDCVSRDGGLMEEIKSNHQHLLPRISNLRAEFDGLHNQAKAFQDQIKDSSQNAELGFSDLRQRMTWLLAGLKHHQAKESDLIYEAINVDIGVGD